MPSICNALLDILQLLSQLRLRLSILSRAETLTLSWLCRTRAVNLLHETHHDFAALNLGFAADFQPKVALLSEITLDHVLIRRRPSASAKAARA